MTAFSHTEILPENRTRYFSMARFALLSALKLLRLRPGARVLVPEFICRDLLAAIHSADAIPEFYAINSDLAPRDTNYMWPDAQVVVAVNYFGFPQDMTEFRSYCDRTGAYLIEDNAHGYMSADEYGTPLGHRGDVGLFSIRKTLLTPNGAALLVNAARLLPLIPPQEAFSKRKLALSFRVRLLLSSLQGYLGLPALSWSKSLVRAARYLRTGYAISPLHPQSEFELPLKICAHRHMLLAISSVNRDIEVTRRRNLYHRFEQEVSVYDVRSVFKRLPTGTVPYGYAFYSSPENAQKVSRLARRSGFDCIRWPDLPMRVEKMAPNHYRSLWMINFLA